MNGVHSHQVEREQKVPAHHVEATIIRAMRKRAGKFNNSICYLRGNSEISSFAAFKLALPTVTHQSRDYSRSNHQKRHL